jgi:hypothetical protein
MPAVELPLNSIAAWNQIAKTTIYQHYNHHTYARAYAQPNFRESEKQLHIRAINTTLTTAWTALTTNQKATWKTPAQRRHEQPQNTFYRTNFARLESGRNTTPTYPEPP